MGAEIPRLKASVLLTPLSVPCRWTMRREKERIASSKFLGGVSCHCAPSLRLLTMYPQCPPSSLSAARLADGIMYGLKGDLQACLCLGHDAIRSPKGKMQRCTHVPSLAVGVASQGEYACLSSGMPCCNISRHGPGESGSFAYTNIAAASGNVAH